MVPSKHRETPKLVHTFELEADPKFPKPTNVGPQCAQHMAPAASLQDLRFSVSKFAGLIMV